MRHLIALLMWCVPLALPAAIGERTLSYGPPFGEVAIFAPEGQPRSLVLFLSGDGGWNLGVISMARHLADEGAIVAGLDVRHYLADIAAHPGTCRYMAADFEDLSHRLQRELKIDAYLVPLLYGYSSGATIVYAILVQSPPGTFGGAVSMGFCPDQKFGGVPLCAGIGAGLHYEPGEKGAVVFAPSADLSDRWIAFQGEIDQVCGAAAVRDFVAKTKHAELVSLPHVGHGYGVERNWLPQFQQVYHELVAQAAPAPIKSAEVADLPLTELPVSGATADAPLVLMLTGDGGWAGLDRGMADAFNARGLPVVGLSTLKYFWHERQPDEAARDVARILQHYLVAWHRERVLLVGYSFGADVLPFIANRLPADLRERVQSVSMLGLEAQASFEIKVGGWVPGSTLSGQAVAPEISRMQGLKALCLYGAGEADDPCPQMSGPALTARSIGSGHHFSGDYTALAAAVLEFSGVQPAPVAPVR
jgi:type IV secretory pathway VirJ component